MDTMPTGTRVRIKAAFRDANETDIVYVTIEDSRDDRGEMPRVRITPETTDLPIPPIESIAREMIEAA